MRSSPHGAECLVSCVADAGADLLGAAGEQEKPSTILAGNRATAGRRFYYTSLLLPGGSDGVR